MKRSLFFIITVLCLSAIFKAEAQTTFAPIGAEWWYNYHWQNNVEPILKRDGTFHTVSEKDTVVAGISCRKVITTKRERVNLSGPGITTMVQKEFYFYDNTDTVFIYNDNFGKFTPLYVWNANDGDTICLPVPPGANPDLRLNPISGDTSFCFVVDSVRIVVYDTTPLRTYYTHALGVPGGSAFFQYPTYNWENAIWRTSDTPGNKGKYIERIIGNFLPYSLLTCVDCYGTVLAPYGNIGCYSDSTCNIKLRDIACDSVLDNGRVNINNINNPLSNSTIYPNPARESITITLERPAPAEVSVRFIDKMGKNVQQVLFPKQVKELSCDVSGLLPGIYVISITCNGNTQFQKITVIR